MEWNTSKSRKDVFHEAVLEDSADADTLQTALTEFWTKTLDELDSQPADFQWDILVVQFITQSGSCMASPMKTKDEYPKSPYTVCLQVDDWIDAYDDLPDPEENEPKFEKAYDRLHKSQVKAVKKAIGDAAVKKRFATLKKRKSFAVYYVDEGETSIRDRMEFLWGNKPPRRDFGSAKELFEYIFNKAELFPANSMRVDGESVVAAKWSGHEFNNDYVDLLEGVPNVQQLCAELNDLVLTATRIDTEGVKRLEKALPDTKLSVFSDDETEQGDEVWRKIR